VLRRRAADLGSAARPESSPAANLLLLVGGATTTVRKYMAHPHLGRFTQPRSQNNLADLAGCGLPWAVDNDALQGLDADAYLAMLGRAGPRVVQRHAALHGGADRGDAGEAGAGGSESSEAAKGRVENGSVVPGKQWRTRGVIGLGGERNRT